MGDNQLLSEKLKYWRAERPSEWLMDEFIRDVEKLQAERYKLREALESLCCDARYLSDHEIDGGAPDNRWEDMRMELCAAERLLNHKEE